MQKCEHNQKITQFCFSEFCIWRDAGGCPDCIRKYHNHVDSKCFADQKQIVKLLTKLTPESYAKPDIKILQEEIRNYFTTVKQQVNNFIDALNKKTLNEFRFSFFTKYGLLETYDKLALKDYRKIGQKQFKKFYEKVNNMNGSQFNKEEKKKYIEYVRKNRSIFDAIFDMFQNLETKSKKLENIIPIRIDKRIENKIKSTLESIDYISKKLEVKLTGNQKTAENNDNHIQLSPFPPQSQNQKRALSSSSSEEPEINFPEINQQQQQRIIEPKYKKNIQITVKPQQQFSFIRKTSKNSKIATTESQQQQQLVPFTNQQYRLNQSNTTNNANMDSRNVQEEFSKQSPMTIEKKNFLSLQKSKLATNNISISILNQDEAIEHTLLLKNSELPSKASDTPKNSLVTTKMKKRSVVIPVKGNTTIEPDDSSPILKRRKQIEKFTLSLKPIQEKQQQSKQLPELTQKITTFSPAEQKSISLLNQSLSCKPIEAISLLQKAFQLSANNLSAAEYLSFLLLEQQKPLQVLTICNKLLENLKGQIIYDVNTLHIHNNKAAALIMMGRYSQSIPLLQTCIQIKEEDRFYKNLGDAYFSIGISEKAIHNYKRSVELNSNYGQAYYNLAVCYYTTGNYNEARINISSALKINPTNLQYIELDRQIKQKI